MSDDDALSGPRAAAVKKTMAQYRRAYSSPETITKRAENIVGEIENFLNNPTADASKKLTHQYSRQRALLEPIHRKEIIQFDYAFAKTLNDLCQGDGFAQRWAGVRASVSELNPALAEAIDRQIEVEKIGGRDRAYQACKDLKIEGGYPVEYIFKFPDDPSVLRKYIGPVMTKLDKLLQNANLQVENPFTSPCDNLIAAKTYMLQIEQALGIKAEELTR